MALLDGLLHCYTPSLGPTGYQLVDRGPRRIHGTAGAGFASTMWAGGSKSQWCLRGNNTANQQFNGCGTFPTGDRTVITWWRCQVSFGQFTVQRNAFFGGTNATGQSFQIVVFYGAIGLGATLTQTGDSINTGLANDGQWHCVAGTNTGSSWALWVDGVLASSKTMTTSQNTTAPVLFGSAFGSWDGDQGETVWWNRILTAAEFREIYRRGDGAIGRALTGQSYPHAQVSIAAAAGGATPWRYARQRSRIIGGGIS